MDIIKTEKLTKYYGKARGIVNLDLTVAEGEFFGFIGPNGAGKSTTIRTLLGLISPTGGCAELFGLDITKKKEHILKDIGYLPSEAIFYRGMKVKDILKLSAELYKKDCRTEADILCQRLELDVSRKVDQLSLGNRKKVAIVCALQHKPKLLILDEPTGGLDPLMQKEFFNILQERNKEGATIFLSSHILLEIQNYCTRAAIIRDGEMIACDSIGALTKTNAKRVTVQGNINLESLNGICDKKILNDAMSFLYNGDIKQLLYTLSTGDITDFTVTEPSLDEIFFHYYKTQGNQFSNRVASIQSKSSQ